MTAPFVPLAPTNDRCRSSLAVRLDMCVGPADRAFMFGGIGLAAAILAVERACERPLIWATAQYLAFAQPPAVVEFETRVTRGRSVTQARTVGRVGESEIIGVSAALGERPGDLSRQWLAAPVVPPPEDCPASSRWQDREGDLHSRMDVRVAGEAPGDGRSQLWIRPLGDHAIDAAMLAIIADHVPSGIGAAIGRHAGGNSLDNTLRVRRLVPTDWVLADIHIQALAAGFAHGAMSLFARDGELMALASQSLIVRMR